jgi:hypothetical protein
VDPADDELIYIVAGDVIEAWPRIEGEFPCA